MKAAPDKAQVKAGLDIEEESFAIIDAEATRMAEFGAGAWVVARRMIHAAGDVSIENELILPDDGVAGTAAALRDGAPIWTDSRMAAVGISRSKLAGANPRYADFCPRSIYEIEGVQADASARGVTRSYAAIEHIGEFLSDCILVIGNAPTALFAALDLADAQGRVPKAIVGMPVGFVGAAESKERLVQEAPCPYLTVRGRRGGSNLAAAAINALASLA